MSADDNQNEKESKTGTYVYDKTLGRVVKVSSDIPSLHKHAGHENCSGPCCSGGAMPDSCPSAGDMGGGCCGGGGCCH
jgi:hypothetical protein